MQIYDKAGQKRLVDLSKCNHLAGGRWLDEFDRMDLYRTPGGRWILIESAIDDDGNDWPMDARFIDDFEALDFGITILGGNLPAELEALRDSLDATHLPPAPNEDFRNTSPDPSLSLPEGVSTVAEDDRTDHRAVMADETAPTRQTRLAAEIKGKEIHLVLDGKTFSARKEREQAGFHFVAALIDANGHQVPYARWVKSHPDFEGVPSDRAMKSLPPSILALIERRKGSAPRLKIESLNLSTGC